MNGSVVICVSIEIPWKMIGLSDEQLKEEWFNLSMEKD
jgi:hypothetical protein